MMRRVHGMYQVLFDIVSLGARPGPTRLALSHLPHMLPSQNIAEWSIAGIDS
jgi:hypothetical protein